MIINGWISDYYEQGMEYDYWLILQDQRYAASRTAGWEPAGLIILQPGDRLSIYHDDGHCIWQGHLGTPPQPHRSGQPLPSNLPWWPTTLTFAEWIGWFRHTPALTAQLERL